ncbi:hypothetical protein KSP40_PGU000577 [Platanthera guangdongensis]|uniref:Uncharacterized protein n=1 Tax=Platanthera guangdongensis TaxID=2320717 RepID=A0ABR2MEQ8_9ASPA
MTYKLQDKLKEMFICGDTGYLSKEGNCTSKKGESSWTGFHQSKFRTFQMVVKCQVILALPHSVIFFSQKCLNNDFLHLHIESFLDSYSPPPEIHCVGGGPPVTHCIKEPFFTQVK